MCVQLILWELVIVVYRINVVRLKLYFLESSCGFKVDHNRNRHGICKTKVKKQLFYCEGQWRALGGVADCSQCCLSAGSLAWLEVAAGSRATPAPIWSPSVSLSSISIEGAASFCRSPASSTGQLYHAVGGSGRQIWLSVLIGSSLLLWVPVCSCSPLLCVHLFFFTISLLIFGSFRFSIRCNGSSLA